MKHNSFYLLLFYCLLNCPIYGVLAQWLLDGSLHIYTVSGGNWSDLMFMSSPVYPSKPYPWMVLIGVWHYTSSIWDETSFEIMADIWFMKSYSRHSTNYFFIRIARIEWLLYYCEKFIIGQILSLTWQWGLSIWNLL